MQPRFNYFVCRGSLDHAPTRNTIETLPAPESARRTARTAFQMWIWSID